MAQGKRTVADDDIIRAMRDAEGPAYTTGEIATRVDMTPEGARGRLEDLVEKGRVMRKKPSPRTVVWWLPEDQSPPVSSKK